MTLEIRPGGTLFERKWDHEDKEFKYIDVTMDGPSLLFDNCVLHKDLILEDIFLLVNKDVKSYAKIIKNWCEEITKEGLTPTDNLECEIDHLEIYFYGNSCKKELSSFGFAEIHGVGDGQTWGISMTGANEIAHLPVKLSDKFTIYDGNHENTNFGNILASYANPTYTLGQILYGIYWELTFHGSPEARDIEIQELDAIAGSFEDESLSTLEFFDGERKLQ